jgi:hypothetical protein
MFEALSLAKEIVITTGQIANIFQNYQNKRDTYLATEIDITTDLEQRRIELLTRLTKSHNRILFEIPDPNIVTQLVPFAIEQQTSLYIATKEADLGRIELSILQIEGALNNYAEARALRARHRTLAVQFALVVIFILVGLIAASPYLGFSTETIVPVIEIPVPVIVWSAIGGLGAMLYRFNNFADAELGDPLRWSFTRPLTAILMGIIAYMVFKLGLIVLQPNAGKAVAPPSELLWLAAFLAGFSDRFADTVLRSLAGRLGGDKQAELHTVEQARASTGEVVKALADRLGWGKPLPPVEVPQSMVIPSSTAPIPSLALRAPAPPATKSSKKRREANSAAAPSDDLVSEVVPLGGKKPAGLQTDEGSQIFKKFVNSLTDVEKPTVASPTVAKVSPILPAAAQPAIKPPETEQPRSVPPSLDSSPKGAPPEPPHE